jgi:hypothetical protein
MDGIFKAVKNFFNRSVEVNVDLNLKVSEPKEEKKDVKKPLYFVDKENHS